MKFTHLFFPTALALLVAAMPLPAQTDDSTDETTAPPGSTVITSDELHSDQANHQSVFSGKVIAVGTNFRLTCQEMTVFFTNDNKVDRIVATGDVIITQPDRITHCGHAEYFRDEDKFVLTQSPIILDHKNQIAGPQITIYRTTQKMEITGGRSQTIIANENMGSAPASGAAPGSGPLPNK
jgi:lipopolysaccharide transport protein LptA